jgi:hypothetical protein
MDLVDPCGNPSWSSQSFMHHHILCDLLHGMHGVPRDAGNSNDNEKMVHRLLLGVGIREIGQTQLDMLLYSFIVTLRQHVSTLSRGHHQAKEVFIKA